MADCDTCPLPGEVQSLREIVEMNQAQVAETHEIVKRIDLSLHGDEQLKILGMVSRVATIESHAETFQFWTDAKGYLAKLFTGVSIVLVTAFIGWLLDLHKLF